MNQNYNNPKISMKKCFLYLHLQDNFIFLYGFQLLFNIILFQFEGLLSTLLVGQV